MSPYEIIKRIKQLPDNGQAVFIATYREGHLSEECCRQIRAGAHKRLPGKSVGILTVDGGILAAVHPSIPIFGAQ